jgi:AmmeMemoRadiSam system protein B
LSVKFFKNYLIFIFSLFFIFELKGKTHKAHLKGWYPEIKTELSKKINDMQNSAKDDFDSTFINSKSIKAIIVPHAGYKYSGVIASAAYRLLPKNFFKKVVILAPDHFVGFRGVSLPDYDQYQTSLGKIDVDTQIINKLKKQNKKLFFLKKETSEQEHSIEIQIPLIQKYCENVKIVPLVVGNLENDDVIKISKIINNIIDDKTLLIISSDFTHFGKNFDYVPFDKNIKENIYNLDSKVVKTIQDKSLNDFQKILKETGSTVCGKNAIYIFMSLLQNENWKNIDSELVAYDCSGSLEENPENSVSYVSLIFYDNKIENNLESKLNNYGLPQLPASLRLS